PHPRGPRPDRPDGVREVGRLQGGRPPVAHGRGSRLTADRSMTRENSVSEPRETQPHQNRWIQEPRHGHGDTVVEYPPNARLEVGYLTDPETHSAVLPPPLTAPPEPRVRVHFTRIEVDGHVHEIVGSFLLDAMSRA